MVTDLDVEIPQNACHWCGSVPPCPRWRHESPDDFEDVHDAFAELQDLIGWMDDDLDGNVAEGYKAEPLAQDWARVGKLSEEVGEAIDALIGITGQNPRKGVYGKRSDLTDELADVALTALYAMQHFTKNRVETLGLLMDRARYHRARREAQLSAAQEP